MNSKNQEIALTQEQLACIDGFQERLDETLRGIVEKNANKGRGRETVEKLFPYLSSESVLSKIIAPTGEDKRHVNLKLACAMVIVFGISLDEIARAGYEAQDGESR